jgi:hypothetical protein
VRALKRNASRNLSWRMPVAGPVVAFSATLLALAVAYLWR